MLERTSGGDNTMTRMEGDQVDEVNAECMIRAESRVELKEQNDDVYKRRSTSRYRVGKGGGLGVVSVGVHTETITQVGRPTCRPNT